MRRSRRGLTALQVFLLVAVVAALGYANERITRELKPGDDFSVAWTASDLWLHQRISPYDERVIQAAQLLVFGRISASDVIHRPILFLMPMPAMLFYAPFGSLTFQLARTVWMTLSEVGLLALCALSLQLARWKGPPWLTGLLLLFAVLWYHSAAAVLAGQFAVIEGLLLTGSLLALRRKLDSVAGLLLGLSSVMPQISFLFIAFVLVWAARARRWSLVLWTCGSAAAIFALSLALLPDWPLQWIAQILRLYRTADARPILVAASSFLPGASSWLSAGLVLLSVIYLGWEWLAVLNQQDRWLQWTSALTLLFTVLLTYRTTTGVFVVLIPGLILAMAVWIDRWGSRAAGWVVLHLLALGGGLWWLSFRTSAGDQESLVMFLPAPFLILIELWWVRWWASRTMRFPP